MQYYWLGADTMSPICNQRKLENFRKRWKPSLIRKLQYIEKLPVILASYHIIQWITFKYLCIFTHFILVQK